MSTPDRPCAFCRIVADDDRDVLVYRSADIAGFLDVRPVFHGHVLLVPRAHYRTLDEVPTALAAPMQTAIQTTMRALRAVFDAPGAFVASNNIVSQSVPHLHWHVVPRRPKDGLRGFFWPRHPYADDAEMVEIRARVRRAIAAVAADGA